MINWIRFAVSCLFVLAGSISLIISIIGIFKFDYALNRIHAASIIDTLVILFYLIALLVAIGFDVVVFKLLFVLIIQWSTSPLSSHMLAKFEYESFENISEIIDIDEEDILK